MVDENADRGQLPGQHAVPERDVEPLWPPDATDPVPPAPLYPSLTAEVNTPPVDDGWTASPPDGDWASLRSDESAGQAIPPDPYAAGPGDRSAAPDGTGEGSGLPFSDGTAGGGPVGEGSSAGGGPEPTRGFAASGAGTPGTNGSAPAPNGTATGDGAPTTNHPTTGPNVPATSGTAAGHGVAAAEAGPAEDTGRPERIVPAPRVGQPAPVDLDLPFTLDQPITTPAPHTAPGTPVVPLSSTAEAGGGRAQGESPWAQPPQRASAGGDEAARGDEIAGSGEAVGSAAVPGQPVAATPPAPKLGPFPPSPGTPLTPPGPHPPTEYPPGPTLAVPPPYAGPPRPGPAPAAPGPQPPAGWYQPSWQEGTPPAGLPRQPYPEQPARAAQAGYPDAGWTPDGGTAPTAEDFARRRQARPADPVATMGVRAVVNRIGLVKLPPGRQEQEIKRDVEMVRRNFGGLRQVTVVNPKGGAGKTVAILLLAMTFGQKRGGYVLAWDNNETQGTLGMRAQQDFHSRTVRDMLRDLGQFQGAHGRIGDLSQYVRSQGEGMFDVLASDESATGGEMLTAAAFAEIREVVSRFYKLIFVDTGNNVRAQNWQAAMDATDQLLVTMSARNDSAETAARMLDHLEQSGRQRLVRQAVTVVSMPPSRKEIDLPAIQEHFAARTRAVLLAPYERLIDTGEPIRYGGLSSATRDAWLKIAAAVAEGL
ncbi:chromosome partitioning protein [Micromonospora sp. NPDC050200]|uniref:MinD/ParA family ATP-binding protein n=1 Tax=Micromonospora sp. NPDC050200 TaxID=3155664 RepID=UPI0033C8206C